MLLPTRSRSGMMAPPASNYFASMRETLDPRKQTAERSLGTLGEPMDQVHSPWIVGTVTSHIPIALNPF